MKAPSAPDPTQTATTQSNLNSATALQQQQMNMIGQQTPWGSLSYQQTGQAFTPDATSGQNYWVDQQGQYHSSLPTQAGTTGAGHWETVTNPNGNSYGNAQRTWVGGGPQAGGTYTPEGWTSVKGRLTPQYTAVQTLSPTQQAIFDQGQAAELNLATVANQQSSRLGDLLNTPFNFDTSKYTSAQDKYQAQNDQLNNFGNRDAEQWAYDLASPRILAQQGQNQGALEAQLVNSGIRRGTPEWNSEMTRLTNANTDQLNQLALTGRQQAFGENQQKIANNQWNIGSMGSRESQDFQTAQAMRNQPLNELLALAGATQIQSPNSTYAQTPQSQVAGVDYSGLVSQNYQNQMQQYNAKVGAIGGLFGAIPGMFKFSSDRRLKKDIRQVGETIAGTPVYEFRYKASPDRLHVGYMAQDLLETQPHAVELGEDGFYSVHYDRVI